MIEAKEIKNGFKFMLEKKTYVVKSFTEDIEDVHLACLEEGKELPYHTFRLSTINNKETKI